MPTIYKYLLIFVGIAIVNVLGRVIFNQDQLSGEILVTLALAVTYCIEQDDKK